MTRGSGDGHHGGLQELQNELNHRFSDLDLLDLALAHASINSHDRNSKRSNERLEFLGDRVLGLLVAEMLYKRFPDENEGALARRHAALVRRDALASVADVVCLGEFIRMSRGEAEGGGRRNAGVLANTCEAVIGATYLDGGLEAAAEFVDHYWRPLMDKEVSPPKDPKTELQEWVQGRGQELPQYREIGRRGPHHAPVFSVEVAVAGVQSVTATGATKRIAEQAAADAMLVHLREKNEP
jgi:ribonuclease-3